MTSINVKITKKMDDKIDQFLETHPYYMNKSEMVRDAIRHLIEDENKLSTETIRVIEKGEDQVERGEGRTLEDVELELDD